MRDAYLFGHGSAAFRAMSTSLISDLLRRQYVEFAVVDGTRLDDIPSVIRRLYKEQWSRVRPKPTRVFYFANKDGSPKLGVEELGPSLDFHELLQFVVFVISGTGAKIKEVKIFAEVASEKVAISGSFKVISDYVKADQFIVEAKSANSEKVVCGTKHDCGWGWEVDLLALMDAIHGKDRFWTH